MTDEEYKRHCIQKFETATLERARQLEDTLKNRFLCVKVRYEFLLGYVADLCGEWFLVKEYDGAIFLRTAGPISMNITNEVDLGCYLKGKTPAPVFKMPEGQLMNESKAPPSFPAKERMSWWKIWK